MAIFRLLEGLPFVRATHVLRAEHDSSRRHLKLQIELNDGSVLFTNEYTAPGIRKYSFHWQTADGTLIARWDNAPHHQELPSFPHHVHRGETVGTSHDVTLEDVLEQIAKWK